MLKEREAVRSLRNQRDPVHALREPTAVRILSNNLEADLFVARAARAPIIEIKLHISGRR